MIGTREAQPIGQIKPNFFSPITIKFSRPLHFDRFAAKRDEPLTLRRITDEIMYELRELSGQEYVNEYAPKKNADTEALPEAPTAIVRGATAPMVASAVA